MEPTFDTARRPAVPTARSAADRCHSRHPSDDAGLNRNRPRWLFDKGKPQYIAPFSMEKAAGRLYKAGSAAPAPKDPDKPSEDKPAADLPDRFIAYLFDDVHMKFGDLAHSRDAAGRHIDTALRTTDRAAIYTTSGQTIQDFTDDRTLLHEALGKLRMRPVTGQGLNHCPNMTYYMADLIVNKNDAITLNAAALDAM